MKFKKDAQEVYTSELWYDLTEGYIRPAEMLADEVDIKEVGKAVDTIIAFFNEAEEAGILKIC